MDFGTQDLSSLNLGLRDLRISGIQGFRVGKFRIWYLGIMWFGIKIDRALRFWVWLFRDFGD